ANAVLTDEGRVRAAHDVTSDPFYVLQEEADSPAYDIIAPIYVKSPGIDSRIYVAFRVSGAGSTLSYYYFGYDNRGTWQIGRIVNEVDVPIGKWREWARLSVSATASAPVSGITAVASTNLFTAPANHGLTNNEVVVFSSISPASGSGVTAG